MNKSREEGVRGGDGGVSIMKTLCVVFPLTSHPINSPQSSQRDKVHDEEKRR